MTPPPAYVEGREDPGVPEAAGRALEALLGVIRVESLDVLWLFPPLRKGRKEHGLLAAGCLPEPDAGRRLLVTLAWRAEETGTGVEFTTRYSEEGEAPPDRLPVIIEGVVRRADAGTGEPRAIPIRGEQDRLDRLLVELGREPLEAGEAGPAPPIESTQEN